MPAHSHLNGKKREKNPIFFLRENERLSSDTRQQNVNLGKREERKLFWLQDSKSLISCRYIYFTAIQLNYAFTADKGYYNDTEIWSWRKSCSEVGLYKLLSSLFYFLCSLLSLSLSLSFPFTQVQLHFNSTKWNCSDKIPTRCSLKCNFSETSSYFIKKNQSTSQKVKKIYYTMMKKKSFKKRLNRTFSWNGIWRLLQHWKKWLFLNICPYSLLMNGRKLFEDKVTLNSGPRHMFSGANYPHLPLFNWIYRWLFCCPTLLSNRETPDKQSCQSFTHNRPEIISPACPSFQRISNE